jgi:hypothetical protein
VVVDVHDGSLMEIKSIKLEIAEIHQSALARYSASLCATLWVFTIFLIAFLAMQVRGEAHFCL